MTAEDGEKVKEKGESEGVDEEIHYRTDCLRAKAKRPSYLYAKVQESSAIDAHRVPRCFPFCAENRAGASCRPHVLWVFPAPTQRIGRGPFTSIVVYATKHISFQPQTQARMRAVNVVDEPEARQHA